MRKFLVISYDSDEQQSFADYILSRTGDTALAYVNAVRPYVVAVMALDLEYLQQQVNGLTSISQPRLLAGMKDLNTHRRWLRS